MWNRRDFIKSVAGMGALTCLGDYEWLAEQLAKSDLTKLTILHTNDWHSHIDPWHSNDPKYPNQGGFNNRVALVDKIRKENEHVLLLDAGDIFQGTPYFNFYGGELEFKLMSKLKYDAATMGNHDFDNGLEGFDAMLPHANFPFICSNYDFSNTLIHQKTKPYLILNKGDIKIGIIGLGVELNGLVTQNLYGETRYLSPINQLNTTASFLKNEENCHLVICLSHLGYEYKTNKISDKILAAESMYTDVIVGGHTHTFLEKPVFVTNKIGQEVMISQAGWAGLRLGQIDLIFERNSLANRKDTSRNFYLKYGIHRLE